MRSNMLLLALSICFLLGCAQNVKFPKQIEQTTYVITGNSTESEAKLKNNRDVFVSDGFSILYSEQALSLVTEFGTPKQYEEKVSSSNIDIIIRNYIFDGVSLIVIENKLDNRSFVSNLELVSNKYMPTLNIGIGTKREYVEQILGESTGLPADCTQYYGENGYVTIFYDEKEMIRRIDWILNVD